jgi:hypothetical protein
MNLCQQIKINQMTGLASLHFERIKTRQDKSQSNVFLAWETAKARQQEHLRSSDMFDS